MAFLKKPSNQLMRSGNDLITSLRTEMDHLFNRFSSLDHFFDEPFFSKHSWHPNADLKETDSSYVVTADLPGLEKKDVSVSLDGNTLTITGERKFESHQDDEKQHQTERFHGSFERVFAFPQGQIDPQNIAAEMKNGVLTITLHKHPGSKGSSQKIEIK